MISCEGHGRKAGGSRADWSWPSSRRCFAEHGSPALPRAPGVPLDLEARRHRLRADDRPGPRSARAARRARSRSRTPRIARRDVSEDGTQKFVLALDDGKQIESVFIPDTPAQTFCISTQVGCAMGCAFCLTGKMGLIRHLTAGEIAGPGARPGACARPRRSRRSISC